MVNEVVQIELAASQQAVCRRAGSGDWAHIFALEGAGGVTRNGLGDTVDTLGVVESGVLGGLTEVHGVPGSLR